MLALIVTAGQRGDSPQFAPPAVVDANTPSTRFDELAVRYQATVQIAAINDWLSPRLSNRP
ncbi:hypothetical protein [Streptomyces hokutonensis]|uniref:Uncharacterized protein n=1 Tax=Streptomyces hokutonensis TaxID=1306990 RepID=A0ABW6LZW7_9ACTN